MKAIKKVILSRKVKATKAAATHITLNAAVPSIDMATDLVNAIDLINHGHIYWGMASLLIIFIPFAMKLGMLMPDFVRGNRRLRQVASLVFAVPFVNPVKQLLLGIRLAFLDPSKKKNSKHIEDIKRDSSQSSFYESILEAGPQLLLQCHIVLSTGQISTLQVVSMASSVLTLTLAASRGFYTQRTREFSDPEPSLQAVFWVFLAMLILVVTAISSWTVIGVVKQFLLLVLFLGATVTWALLWSLEKRRQKENGQNSFKSRKKDEGRNTDDGIPIEDKKDKGDVVKVQDNIDLKQGEVTNDTSRNPTVCEEEDECLEFDENASLCDSMGYCCKFSGLLFFYGLCCICRTSSRQEAFSGKPLDLVIEGEEHVDLYKKYQRRQTYLGQIRKYYMEFTRQLLDVTRAPIGSSEEDKYFGLKSSICSQWVPCIVGNFRDKTLLISAVASFTTRTVALVAVLLLVTFDFPESLQRRTTLLFCHDAETLKTLQLKNICVGLSCFVWDSYDGSISHKYRICEGDDHTFEYMGIAILVAFNVLSLLSIFWLHHVSNYSNLHQISKCWPSFCPCRRIAHRSLVMKYIKKGNAEKLEEVLTGSPQEAGSRQDGDGVSPVEAAISSGQGECLRKLIHAKVEMPEIRAHIASYSSDNEVVFQNNENVLKLRDLDLNELQVLHNDCKVTKVKRKMGVRAL